LNAPGAIRLIVGLADAVHHATAPLGFTAGHRELRPHVTVARGRRAHDLRPVLAALGDDPVGPAWSAGAAVLFESRTHPEGAVHRELARVPLTGRSTACGA